MTRSIFSQEMQEVKGATLLLGSMVEEAVMESVAALRDNNVERSRFVTASDEIWAAHNIERLGGRAADICEQVIYIVMGERYEYVPVTPESKLLEYDS